MRRLSALLLITVAAGCASGTGTPRVDAGVPLDGSGDGSVIPTDGHGASCHLDSDCDDHNACNGTDRCVANACTPGVAVDCDDHVGCTLDSCDTGTGVCGHMISDAMCTTGLICDPIMGCSTPRPCTTDPDCDDHIFCNGPERCDLAFGCRHGAVPSCDDSHTCTTDTCDATTDACLSTPTDSVCDDGLACNGAEVCRPTDSSANSEGCIGGTAPVCDDGIPCTADVCDETAHGCTSVASDALCDDHVFCNGVEHCDVPTRACVPGTVPPCDDPIGCTVGSCDATTDACAQTADDNACSDGRACNGAEHCDPTGTTPGTGCVMGAPLDCSDGMACTTDGCAEPGMCTHGGSDSDADGYTARGCSSGDDCDDLNPRVHPGAAELCDGIDNDCSGTGLPPSGVDDGAGMECPFGSAPRSCTTTCGTAGTQPCDGSCRLGLCRAAAETCNGCDDNGNGLIDEPGAGSPVQCRAGDVRPCTVAGCGTLGTQTCNSGCDWNRCVATEVCNACDDDGDGVVDNGFSLGGACTAGVGECTRMGTVVCRSDGTGTLCSATPGTPVAELCNARDDNCNGLTDEAFTELGLGCNVGTGACRRTGVFVCRADATGTQCSATAGMPTTELCNSIDDNCNGLVDDGADGGACDGPDTDLCAEGTNRCMSGTLVCDDATGNNVEVCNGIDDNCNGTTDEGCACMLGATRACYGGPMGTSGVGICRDGMQTCVVGSGGVGSMWGSCTGAITPATETCNSMDDDCNGTVDNGNPGGGALCDGPDTDLCNEGTLNCTGGTLVCSDATGNSVETCNAVDDNCNGSIDEGNPGGGGGCDGADGDLCIEGTFNCTGGTLVCSDMTSTNVEICNNADDNCNGSVDEGNPGGGALCDGADTDLCQEGTINCSGGALTCSDATGSTVEICGNGVDDDCNPATPDMCTVPNDHCAGAIALTGSGSRTDTLVGATTDVADCFSFSGPDIFYSVNVAVPSVVYLSTLAGATFDTTISYRGTSCPGSAVQCVDDSCGTLQTQLAQLVPAGTSYFAVHSYSGATGTVGLTYGIYVAAGGTNTFISPTPASGTMMSFSGTTAGPNRIDPSCIGLVGAPENSYYWMQCPADVRAYSANLCGATWDTALHLHLNGGVVACNDDSCGLQSSFSGAASSGQGLVQLFVDGYWTYSGAYTCPITF